MNKVIFNKNYQHLFFYQFLTKFNSDRDFFKKHNFKFIMFFKKNSYLLSFNFYFYKILLNMYFTVMYLINNNFNMFFFNSLFKEINANIINLNYFNSVVFNKNFFFFFFKFSFLKNPLHSKKFLSLMNNNSVKLLFFFNTQIPPYALSVFLNKGLFLGGLTSLKKTSLFDFPFVIDENNIFNTFFFYTFFIKLSVYKNNSSSILTFKHNFIFYSFFDFY